MTQIYCIGGKHFRTKGKDATLNMKQTIILILFMTNTDGKKKEINICHKDFQKYSKIKVPILLHLNIPSNKGSRTKMFTSRSILLTSKKCTEVVLGLS